MERRAMDRKDRKNVTIADIAQELGVSKTTVSRSISGKGRIGEATRRRVMQFIAENGYRPNVIAQGLANSCTYNIGVIMPENFCVADAAFFTDCLSGIHQAAAEREYDILLTVCDNIHMNHLERMVQQNKADGAVLMRTFVQDRAVQLLKESGLPFVVIGQSPYKDVVQIDQDNEKACKELVVMLLRQERTQPALIGGSMEQVVNRKRLAGYLSACRQERAAVQDSLIYTGCTSPCGIHAAVQDILKSGVSCIACMDDNICLETLNYLKLLGVAIPRQVRVASFFYSTVLENYVPSVTSVSYNVKKLGMVSGTCLIDIIEEKELSSLLLPEYEISLKESTQIPV